MGQIIFIWQKQQNTRHCDHYRASKKHSYLRRFHPFIMKSLLSWWERPLPPLQHLRRADTQTRPIHNCSHFTLCLIRKLPLCCRFFILKKFKWTDTLSEGFVSLKTFKDLIISFPLLDEWPARLLIRNYSHGHKVDLKLQASNCPQTQARSWVHAGRFCFLLSGI